VGSTSFVELFVVEVLYEDLGTISSLPMLANLQATFMMLSLCYAQRLGYFFRTMFSSPNILQHYAKFDIHTIVMLEKLLGAGSFGGSIGHLVRHQTIFCASLGRFNLPFVVRTTTLAFLGC
jgi:hypothetical protein